MAKHALNQPYNPKKTQQRNGLIIDLTPQAQKVYDAVEAGISVGMITTTLNVWRAAQKIPPLEQLSYSAVEGFIDRSEILRRGRRTTKKSGKDDPETAWAMARLAQMQQLKTQFAMGKLLPNDPVLVAFRANPLNPPPIKIDNVVFWDEKHHKIRLGHASKTETQVARNAQGEPCSPANGGVFPEPNPITIVKFPGEARALFGCAVRKQRNADGTFTMKELARVLPKRGIWGAVGAGYPEAFPPPLVWQDHLHAKVDETHCCVKELIDHVITESTAIYANTEYADNFLIFHDALSQWWEDEAQEYIAQRGFRDRQVRCFGDTNAGTRYEGKLTGDSPEMCRGLDSHGFADLVCSMQLHGSLSSLYPAGDPRRFGLGTPEEVWSTMSRCWLMEPTSERIVQDVSKWEAVVDIIIAARGCVVQDIFFRSGRRGDEWMRAKGDGQCKNKPRARQRKATLKLRPIHPDCVDAFNRLTTDAAPDIEAEHDILMANILMGFQLNFQAANQNNGDVNDGGRYHDHV
eukprot:gene34523-42580_t